MKTTKQNQISRINKQTRDQLGGLTAMFLLGMGVNLIGLPSQVTGGANTATSIILSLHVLIAFGLLAGATVTVIRAKTSVYMKQSWIGLAAIILTFSFGVMTVATENNWWSYAMSIGFIVSFWIYGLLFVKTRDNANLVKS